MTDALRLGAPDSILAFVALALVVMIVRDLFGVAFDDG